MWRKINARDTIIFSDGKPWKKSATEDLFDVTMGSFDGAETCELVVCYILSKLQGKYGRSIGLYRDDGLGAFNCTPRQMENIKKQICEVFCDCGLR